MPPRSLPKSPLSPSALRRERTDMRLLRRIHRSQDQAARHELTARCLPLVRSLARRYADRGEELEDLVQVGLVGLVKAMDRFDPEAGHRFVSFAAPNVTGEIRRHFRDHCWALHVPRAMQELDAKVHATGRALAVATGREPTDEDVARELGLPVTAVHEARTAGRAFHTVSTDAPVGEGMGLIDTHGADDDGYAHVEDVATLRCSMDVLDARERDVLRMRFQDDLLQREIAVRIGVSQMQVSRILAGAIARMQRHVAPSGGPAGGELRPAPRPAMAA